MYGNLTVLLIKPEGMKHLSMIRRKIQEARLKIIEQKSFFWVSAALAEDTIRKLFPVASDAMVEAIVRHFRGHATMVLLISGENAITRLCTIVGEHNDPRKCSDHSIRAWFRNLKPVETDDGPYYKDGVYCPPDMDETIRALGALFVRG